MKIKELVILLTVILIVSVVSTLNSCNNLKFPSISSYEIIDEKASNSLPFKAVKLKVNAGATVRNSYKLVIVGESEKITGDSHAVFISYGDFDFSWKNNNLLVKFVGTERIFKQEKKHKNINIIYESN